MIYIYTWYIYIYLFIYLYKHNIIYNVYIYIFIYNIHPVKRSLYQLVMADDFSFSLYLFVWLNAHDSWCIPVFQDWIVNHYCKISLRQEKNCFCFVQVGPLCNHLYLHDKWHHPRSRMGFLTRCPAAGCFLGLNNLLTFATNDGYTNDRYKVATIVGRGMKIIDGTWSCGPRSSNASVLAVPWEVWMWKMLI